MYLPSSSKEVWANNEEGEEVAHERDEGGIGWGELVWGDMAALVVVFHPCYCVVDEEGKDESEGDVHCGCTLRVAESLG